MRIGVLGAVELWGPDGTAVSLGGPRPRALLAALALSVGRPVPFEDLVDAVYGDEPPANAQHALQSQVSRIRSLLPAGSVTRHPLGYVLAIEPDEVDAHRFERLALEGRQLLALGDHANARKVLSEALALWRGPAPSVRLDDLRLSALEDRIEADLATGQSDAAELRQLTADHPYRERLRGQLMRALAADGRQAEALASFDDARRTLADEFGADPSAALADAHLAVLRGANPVRPVPAQLSSFIGRDKEIRRVGDALRAARLVTITGPGGAGKTRLAIESARRVNEVCFVELAELGDSAQVPQAVIGALGLRDGGLFAGGDAPDPVTRLIAGLADRDLLLVLDNCEHVIDGAARLARRLLASCPGLRILATSRETLGLTGELLCPLPPLAAPDTIRLFEERAHAVRPGYRLDAEVVGQICAAVDGLPLGIELAAARLRSFELDEVRARLGRLSHGDRTAEPRHQTLRAVVAWSWDLLDDDERAMARRLSVFAGGATLSAAEEVCGRSADVLASLVDKSLVEVNDGRYRMLETVRAFCSDQLGEESERARRRHAEYFLRLAEEAEPRLRTGEQLEWMDRLTAEHANLMASLRWAVGADSESALRLAANTTWYLYLRGLRSESIPLITELMINLGERSPAGLGEEYALCAISANMHLDQVATVLRELGRTLRFPYLLMLWALIGTADALALEMFGDDQWSRAFVQTGEGLRTLYHGQLDVSRAAFERACALFRAVGDRWGIANTVDLLAGIAALEGDPATALSLVDEAIEVIGQLGDAEDAAELQCRRADNLVRLGEVAAARAIYERVAGLGIVPTTASAHRGLGEIARLAGDLDTARQLHERALSECPSGSIVATEIRGRILCGLGAVAAAQGYADRAREHYERARDEALARQNLPMVATAEQGLSGGGLTWEQTLHRLRERFVSDW
ncbi:BTAD domain-containing putative transcriptional regulator [Kutzneria sp. NPDC052558]|uniref:BTAD domain-containing putative transcriptional regulator n=1 Tax=Kutzneria sp. NPDC052558 TaxID=3364121 RepID=UPI0037C537E9